MKLSKRQREIVVQILGLLSALFVGGSCAVCFSGCRLTDAKASIGEGIFKSPAKIPHADGASEAPLE